MLLIVGDVPMDIDGPIVTSSTSAFTGLVFGGASLRACLHRDECVYYIV